VFENKDNFKFHMPIDLEKGVDKAGNEVMLIKGIASTPDKDTQGEYLDPAGFDLSEFKFINWNHKQKDDAGSIIGEPTLAKIDKDTDQLYIEGYLYPQVKMARATYSLMQALKNSKRGNRLGLSVEGKVLERDPFNKNRVSKSKLTAVAVCPIPINRGAWCDLAKSTDAELDVEEDLVKSVESFWNKIDEDDAFKAYVEENNESGKAGTEIEEIPVDEHRKLIEGYEKAISAQGNQNLQKESVEGGQIKLSKIQQDREEKDTKNKKIKQNSISKSEAVSKIVSYFYPISIEKAKKAYKIFQKLEVMTDENKFDQALEALNKSINAIEKGDKNISEDEAYKMAKGMYSKKEKDEVVGELEKAGCSSEVAKAAYLKVHEEEKGGEVTNEKEPISKSYLAEVFTAFDKKFGVIGSAIGEMKKSYDEVVGTLKEENESLRKSLDERGEELKKASDAITQIANASKGQKHLNATQFAERFDTEIEKSEDGKSVYDMNNQGHRAQLKQVVMANSDIAKSEGQKMGLLDVAQNLETFGDVAQKGSPEHSATTNLLKEFDIELRY